MKFIIIPHQVAPKLLEFEVRILENHFERRLPGTCSFHDILGLLFRNWNVDFTIELR